MVTFREVLSKTGRGNTLEMVFLHLVGIQSPRIVETGCVRAAGDWSAGYFGYLGNLWCVQYGGSMVSVDISPENCELARRVTGGEVVESDSVLYLRGRTEPVDLLYLDSLDVGERGCAEHCLMEAVEGNRLVVPGGLIVIDDTYYQGLWRGKGEMAVAYLMGCGWEVAGKGKQAVMRRKG